MGSEFWDYEMAVLEYEKFTNKLSDLNLKCTIVEFRNIFDDIQETVFYGVAHLRHKYYNFVAAKLLEEIHPLIRN